MREVRDITGANVKRKGAVPDLTVVLSYGAHFVGAALVDSTKPTVASAPPPFCLVASMSHAGLSGPYRGSQSAMLMPSMVGETVAATKQVLRGNAKFLRGRIDAGERQRAAEALVRHAATLPLLAVPPVHGVVAVYYPIGGELDVRLLVDWLRQIGWQVALPMVEQVNEPLVFRLWQDDAPLDIGPYGTRHPPHDAPLCVPQVILIPLLAFDAVGYRLGYGGGYYDRTLAALFEAGHRPAAIGVAFSVQEIEMVPHESWDCRLNLVLTERGVLPLREAVAANE